MAGSTEARGYGYRHRKASEHARANLVPGTPCCRCYEPMWPEQRLHLDHDDYDRTQYGGLAHAWCNIAAGNRSHRRQQTRRQSRDWYA